MSDEEKKSEPKKNSSDLLDMITRSSVKITAVIVALTALLVAAKNFSEISSKFFAMFKAEESVKDCFQAEMNYPKTVSVSEWQSMPLSLTGRNDCREKLGVHIAFKAKQLDKVRIESPVSDCLDPVDPRCWEEKSIEAGEVNEKFIPPHLEVLKKPLGDTVDININWVVYDVETKKLLDAGVAQSQLTDDPVVSENANGAESSNPRAREQQKLKEANRIAEMERQERLKLQREMEGLRKAQEQEQAGAAAKEQAASNDVLDTLEVGTRRERKVILVGGFSGVQANRQVEIVIEPPMAKTYDYKWEIDGCPNDILGGTAGPRFRFDTGDKGICIIRLSSTCKAPPIGTLGCVSDVWRRPYRLPIREPVRN